LSAQSLQPAQEHDALDQDSPRKLGEGLGSRRQILQQRGNSAAVDTLGERDDDEAAQEPRRGPVPYKQELEAAFGGELGDVEAWFNATEMLGELGASAAAIGGKLYFAESSPDKELVAHELAHIAQGRKLGGGGAGVSDSGSGAEQEASAAAEAAVRGESVDVQAPLSADVHRNEDDKTKVPAPKTDGKAATPGSDGKPPPEKLPLPAPAADPHAGAIAAAEAEVKTQTERMAAHKAELERIRNRAIQVEMDLYHGENDAGPQKQRDALVGPERKAQDELRRATQKATEKTAHAEKLEGKLERARASFEGKRPELEEIKRIETDLANKRTELRNMQEARAALAVQAEQAAQAKAAAEAKAAAAAEAAAAKDFEKWYGPDSGKGVMTPLGEGRFTPVVDAAVKTTTVFGGDIDPTVIEGKVEPGSGNIANDANRAQKIGEGVQPRSAASAPPPPPAELELQRQIAELEGQRAHLDPLQQGRAQLEGGERRLAELEARVNEARAAQEKATTAVDDATKRHTGLKESLTQAEADLKAHKEYLASAKSELDSLRSSETATAKDLSASKTQLQNAQDGLDTAKAHKTSTKTAVGDAETGVKDAETAKTEAEKVTTDAETAKADAETAKVDAEGKGASPDGQPKPNSAPDGAPKADPDAPKALENPKALPESPKALENPKALPGSPKALENPKALPGAPQSGAPRVDGAVPRGAGAAPRVDGPGGMRMGNAADAARAGGKALDVLGKGADAASLVVNTLGALDSDKDDLDRAQHVVGGVGDAAGLVPLPPAQALSWAVGLQQSGDAHRARNGEGSASDVAAKEGADSHEIMKDLTGSELLADLSGLATTAFESVDEGIKNFGYGAVEMGTQVKDLATDAYDYLGSGDFETEAVRYDERSSDVVNRADKTIAKQGFDDAYDHTKHADFNPLRDNIFSDDEARAYTMYDRDNAARSAQNNAAANKAKQADAGLDKPAKQSKSERCRKAVQRILARRKANTGNGSSTISVAEVARESGLTQGEVHIYWK